MGVPYGQTHGSGVGRQPLGSFQQLPAGHRLRQRIGRRGGGCSGPSGGCSEATPAQALPYCRGEETVGREAAWAEGSCHRQVKYGEGQAL